MRRKGVFCVALLSFLLVCLAFSVQASGLYISGKKIEFDVSPDVLNESVLVPLDQFTDDYDMEIVAFSRDQLFIYHDKKYCILNLGSREAQLNNENVFLSTAPLEVNGHFLVPLGFICDFLDVNYFPNEGIKLPVPINRDGIKAEVLLEDRILHNGDEVKVHLLVENEGRKKEQLHFKTGQRFDFLIRNHDGEIVYRWSEGKMFVQSISKVTLDEGESMLFSATLDINGLTPGLYELIGVVTSHKEVYSEPVRIVIRKF